MAFCSGCGQKLEDGSRFCPRCGKSVGGGNPTQREQVFEGNIRKCPNCGATLSSFVSHCPECGHEFRDTKSSHSVQEFSRNYAIATNLSQKIDLVRSFVIPNTKEDILEFAILASSNIDEGSFTRDNTVVSGGVSQTELSEAWMAKFEQAYQKANILLQGDTTLKTISKLYEEKKKALSSAKVKSVSGKVVKRIFKSDFSPLIILIAVGFIVLGGMEWKLRKQVKQIETYIAEENYDSALTVAYAMEDNFNSSWRETRADLIRRIKKLQAEENHTDGQLSIPSKNFNGKQYSDVVSAFKSAGFTNVKAEPISYDLLTGWIDKLTEPKGEVAEISVDGDTSYDKYGWFSPDVPIIIRYYH